MNEKWQKRLFSLFIISGIVLYIDRCSEVANRLIPPTETEILIERDTIFPDPVVIELPPKRIPVPTYVYLDTITREVTPEPASGKKIKKYTDSLADSNLTFYYTTLVDGELINNDFEYKLHVPLTITNTVTKLIPTNGIYLTTELGGNRNQFNNLSLGAMYLNKKRNSFNYRYNFMQKSHNIGVGFKIK